MDYKFILLTAVIIKSCTLPASDGFKAHDLIMKKAKEREENTKYIQQLQEWNKKMVSSGKQLTEQQQREKLLAAIKESSGGGLTWQMLNQ